MKRVVDTKMKIAKGKLMMLFDGDSKMASEMGIEEIVEHILFRLRKETRVSPIKSARATSIQSARITTAFQTCDRENRQSPVRNLRQGKTPTTNTHFRKNSFEAPRIDDESETKENCVQKRGSYSSRRQNY